MHEEDVQVNRVWRCFCLTRTEAHTMLAATASCPCTIHAGACGQSPRRRHQHTYLAGNEVYLRRWRLKADSYLLQAANARSRLRPRDASLSLSTQDCIVAAQHDCLYKESFCRLTLHNPEFAECLVHLPSLCAAHFHARQTV